MSHSLLESLIGILEVGLLILVKYLFSNTTRCYHLIHPPHTLTHPHIIHPYTTPIPSHALTQRCGRGFQSSCLIAASPSDGPSTGLSGSMYGFGLCNYGQLGIGVIDAPQVRDGIQPSSFLPSFLSSFLY